MLGALAGITQQQGAGGFSPLDLPSVFNWLESDDLSDFTFGTGSAVSQWNDRSGNGTHVAQASGILQPLRTGSLNGRPTVVFDGSNDVLTSVLASSAWKFLSDGTTPFTVALVFSYTTNLSAPVVSTSAIDGGKVGFVLSGNSNGGAAGAENSFVVNAAGVAIQSANAAGSLPHTVANIIVGRYDPSNGTASLRSKININGGATSQTNTSTAAPNTSLPERTLNVKPTGGQLAAAVICKASISDTEVDDLNAYWSAKWGITI
jgi:hypothetical protein